MRTEEEIRKRLDEKKKDIDREFKRFGYQTPTTLNNQVETLTLWWVLEE